jgi:hypothetical protein
MGESSRKDAEAQRVDGWDATVLGKPLYREKMRNLPLPEKVRIVVELQKIAAPILRARGENPFVWQIEDEKK